MEIRLRLYKSVIIKAAKDETYLSGRAVLSEDGSNSEKVYNMQAGDDETHEAKLLRSIRVGLDDLKSQLTNFVKNEGAETGDNISDTMEDDYDYFDIVLDVSTRFNKGYVNSLASMCSSYITDYTIATWWTAVSPTLSTSYYSSATATLGNIKRCFIKMPPKSPVFKYPTQIIVEDEQLTSNFNVGETRDIEYEVFGEDATKCIDDVVAEVIEGKGLIAISGSTSAFKVTKVKEFSNVFPVVRLYSKHNPEVFTDIDFVS